MLSTELTKLPSPQGDTSKAANLRTLFLMYTEPSSAFGLVLRRGSAWFPLCLLIASATALLLWYYQIVDLGWFQDKLLASSDPMARKSAGQYISKNMLMATNIGGVVMKIPVIYSAYAFYFLIVAKLMKVELGFGKWFAFVTWASVPSLLGLPLGAIQILLAQNGQLDPGQLNPVSLNAMLFHIERGQRWASLLNGISLTSLWSMFLMGVGWQSWTGQSRGASVAVSVAPFMLINGIWAVVILASKA